MDRKTLAEYVAANGQTETARQAGLTQGAIWQMLNSDRRVYVKVLEDDTIELEEIRPIKRNNAA